MSYPAQLWLFWLLLVGSAISLLIIFLGRYRVLCACSICLSLELSWLYWSMELPITLEGFSLIALASQLVLLNSFLGVLIVGFGLVFKVNHRIIWGAILGCVIAAITFSVFTLIGNNWWLKGIPIPQNGRIYAQETLQSWQDNPDTLPWGQLVAERRFIESKIRVLDYTIKTERGLFAGSPWYISFNASYGASTEAIVAFQLLSPQKIVLTGFRLHSYVQAFPNPILEQVESTAQAWLSDHSRAPWAWALEWLPNNPKPVRIIKTEQKGSTVAIEYALSDGSTLTWVQEPRTIVVEISNPQILEQFCPPPGRWIGRCF